MSSLQCELYYYIYIYIYIYIISPQSSTLSQKQKESAQALSELNKQLEGVKTELAESRSLSESLKKDLEQVNVVQTPCTRIVFVQLMMRKRQLVS